MKKKISLLVFALATSTGAFAQDARSAVNQILDKYAMPIFLGGMLIGIIAGLWQQWDNIIDKENRGTRKDGLLAIAWYVGYALLAAIVVSAVTTAISQISLQV